MNTVINILGRYNETTAQVLRGKNIWFRANTVPKNLNRQVSIKIARIIDLTPDSIEEIEKQLKIIRDNNNELEKEIRAKLEEQKRKEEEEKKREEERKKEEEKKKKIANSYWIYTRYLTTWQYQSATKFYRGNSEYIVDGYISFMSTDALWDYISKLATTVCTKNTLKKLPRYYAEHIFMESLPSILKKQSDVVKLSQDNIRHIAQFFPLWEQFLVQEEVS